MRLTGDHWNYDALFAIGAQSITAVADQGGAVIGFDVEPSIDITGYEEAMTKVLAGNPAGLRLEGADWDESTLFALGATRLAEIRDDAGQLIGYEVDPAIDVSGYEAALAKQMIDDLKSYARQVSWEKRVGGLPVDGIYVATDAEGLTLINGLKAMAEDQPDRTFSYDSPAGPIPLSAQGAINLARAVGNFVQSTFDLRSEVLGAVDAGEITTRDQIDAAFSSL